tara:strand:+ start:272 stop:517 length:246 start_codon:yes stop_codon:yes gene_type:complete
MKGKDEFTFKITVNDKNNKVTLNIGGFSSEKEREKFADLLHQTLKYDKLYLISALEHIEEQILEDLGDSILWYGEEHPTIH